MARKIYRLQVELNQEQLTVIEDLQNSGGLRTKKDLLDNALTLLKWSVKQKKEGHLIVAMNPNTGAVKELQLPYLEKVQERAQSQRSEKDASSEPVAAA